MNIQYLKISRRVGLIDLIKAKGFKVGVEVGTDKGQYARDICERYPEFKLYTIDPFKAFTSGTEDYSQFEMDEIHQIAIDTLAPYPQCKIINNTSMNAVKLFDDESLDFVFIDGHHEYKHVIEDIEEWTKKVKSGGIVSGHDYVKRPDRKYGIIEAVDEYVERNNIDPLFILKKGTFTNCWMFFK